MELMAWRFQGVSISNSEAVRHLYSLTPASIVYVILSDYHWLSISSFSVEKLVKNVHFFHPFFTEKVGENLKTFSALF
jgi:hypothetical protein